MEIKTMENNLVSNQDLQRLLITVLNYLSGVIKLINQFEKPPVYTESLGQQFRKKLDQFRERVFQTHDSYFQKILNGYKKGLNLEFAELLKNACKNFDKQNSLSNGESKERFVNYKLPSIGKELADLLLYFGGFVDSLPPKQLKPFDLNHKEHILEEFSLDDGKTVTETQLNITFREIFHSEDHSVHELYTLENIYPPVNSCTAKLCVTDLPQANQHSPNILLCHLKEFLAFVTLHIKDGNILLINGTFGGASGENLHIQSAQGLELKIKERLNKKENLLSVEDGLNLLTLLNHQKIGANLAFVQDGCEIKCILVRQQEAGDILESERMEQYGFIQGDEISKKVLEILKKILAPASWELLLDQDNSPVIVKNLTLQSLTVILPEFAKKLHWPKERFEEILAELQNADPIDFCQNLYTSVAEPITDNKAKEFLESLDNQELLKKISQKEEEIKQQ